MDVDFLVQQLVNGLTLGSVYALIALGYSMVYGILKLLNFAHGEVYMMGAFIGYFVLIGLGGPDDPAVPVGLLILLMFLAAMLGSGLLGVTIERFAYRPLRNSPRLAPLISAIATGTVRASFDRVKVSANKNSFQAAIKARSPVVTSAGHRIGRNTRVTPTHGVAPSM